MNYSEFFQHNYYATADEDTTAGDIATVDNPMYSYGDPYYDPNRTLADSECDPGDPEDPSCEEEGELDPEYTEIATEDDDPLEDPACEDEDDIEDDDIDEEDEPFLDVTAEDDDDIEDDDYEDEDDYEDDIDEEDDYEDDIDEEDEPFLDVTAEGDEDSVCPNCGQDPCVCDEEDPACEDDDFEPDTDVGDYDPTFEDAYQAGYDAAVREFGCIPDVDECGAYDNDYDLSMDQ